MRQSKVVYSDEPGRQNTADTLALTRERAKQFGFEYLVVAIFASLFSPDSHLDIDVYRSSRRPVGSICLAPTSWAVMCSVGWLWEPVSPSGWQSRCW